MKTDEYLYGTIALGYKEMQRSLADHKISQAKKLRDELCDVEPKHRDSERIHSIDKAIAFWTDAKGW